MRELWFFIHPFSMSDDKSVMSDGPSVISDAKSVMRDCAPLWDLGNTAIVVAQAVAPPAPHRGKDRCGATGDCNL